MAFFEGLVETEDGVPVAAVRIGGESFYVIDDQGFRRHVDAQPIDRAVLAQFLGQAVSRALGASGTPARVADAPGGVEARRELEAHRALGRVYTLRTDPLRAAAHYRRLTEIEKELARRAEYQAMFTQAETEAQEAAAQAAAAGRVSRTSRQERGGRYAYSCHRDEHFRRSARAAAGWFRVKRLIHS